MNARVAAGIVLLCSILLSCTVSEKAPKKVLKADGEAVRIELAGQRKVSGELLCVNDTSLYFLAVRIQKVALAEVVSVKVEGYDSFEQKELRGQLERYSRYPACLSEAQWRQLLDHYGQKEIVESSGQ